MRLLAEIKLSAKLDNLHSILESVLACAKKEGLDREKLYHVQLATEESVVNVVKYAYPEGDGEVVVRCQADESFFTIEIVDSGVPFDTTAAPAPDITKDLAERRIGGLGIFLTKSVMDDVQYRREDGRNILLLSLRRGG